MLLREHDHRSLDSFSGYDGYNFVGGACVRFIIIDRVEPWSPCLSKRSSFEYTSGLGPQSSSSCGASDLLCYQKQKNRNQSIGSNFTTNPMGSYSLGTLPISKPTSKQPAVPPSSIEQRFGHSFQFWWTISPIHGRSNALGEKVVCLRWWQLYYRLPQLE